MIYYAAEILFVVFVVLIAIVLYRCLLYSQSFTRFVETTFNPLQEPEQIEAAIDAVHAEAASFIDHTSEELERKAAALRRVRKFSPKRHPNT